MTLIKTTQMTSLKDIKYIMTQPAFTCSKSTIGSKAPELTPLRTYFTPCSGVFIVKFEHVIAGWAGF